MPAKSLSEIQTELANSDFAGKIDVGHYSQLQHELYGGNDYASGINPNYANKINAWLDQNVAHSRASDSLAMVGAMGGEALDRYLGNTNREFESAGERGGRAALRSTLDMAGWIDPRLRALKALGAADVGIKAYSESNNNPVAGLVSAASLPASMYLGGKGANLVGGQLEKYLGPAATDTVVSGAEGLASQTVKAAQPGIGLATRAALMETGRLGGFLAGAEIPGEAVSKATTGEFYNPLEPTRAFESAIGLLPFLPMNVAGGRAYYKGQVAEGKANINAAAESNAAYENKLLDELNKWMDPNQPRPVMPEGPIDPNIVSSRFDERYNELVNSYPPGYTTAPGNKANEATLPGTVERPVSFDAATLRARADAARLNVPEKVKMAKAGSKQGGGTSMRDTSPTEPVTMPEPYGNNEVIVNSRPLIERAVPEAPEEVKSAIVNIHDKVVSGVRAALSDDPVTLAVFEKFVANDTGLTVVKQVMELANQDFPLDDSIRMVAKGLMDASKQHAAKTATPLLSSPEDLKSSIGQVKVNTEANHPKMAAEFIRDQYASGVRELTTSPDGLAFLKQKILSAGTKEPEKSLMGVQAVLSDLTEGKISVRNGKLRYSDPNDSIGRRDLLKRAGLNAETADEIKSVQRLLDNANRFLSGGSVIKEFVKAKYGKDLPELQRVAELSRGEEQARQAEVVQGGLRVIDRPSQIGTQKSEVPGMPKSPQDMPETLDKNVITKGDNGDISITYKGDNSTFVGQPGSLAKVFNDVGVRLGFSSADAAMMGKMAGALSKLETYISNLAFMSTTDPKGLRFHGAILKGATEADPYNIGTILMMMPESLQHTIKAYNLQTPEARAALIMNIGGHEYSHVQEGDVAHTRTEMSRDPEYIAALPKGVRDRLERAREIVKSMLPQQQADAYSLLLQDFFDTRMVNVKAISEIGKLKATLLDIGTQNILKNGTTEALAEINSLLNIGMAWDAAGMVKSAAGHSDWAYNLAAAYRDGMSKVLSGLNDWVSMMSIVGNQNMLEPNSVRNKLNETLANLISAKAVDPMVADALSKVEGYHNFLSGKGGLPWENLRMPEDIKTWYPHIDHPGASRFQASMVPLFDIVKEAVGAKADKDGNFVVNPGWRSEFMRLRELATRHPILKQMADAVEGYPSHVAQNQAIIAKTLFGNHERIQDTPLYKLQRDSTAKNIFNKIADEQQVAGEAGGQMFTAEEIISKATAQGASPERANLIATTLQQFFNSGQAAGAMLRMSFRDHQKWMISTILQSTDPSMSWDTARSTADKVQAAIYNQQPLPTNINPEAIAALSKHAPEMIQADSELASLLSSRPWFLSTKRYGDVVISYKNQSGEKVTVSSKNMADAEKKMASLRDSGMTEIKPTVQGMSREQGAYPNSVANAMLKFDAIMRGIVTKLPSLSESRRAELLEKLPGQGTIEASIQGMQKFFLKRNLAAGHEQLDYADNMLNYIQSVSSSSAKQHAWDMSNAILNDPQMLLAENQMVRDLAQRHVKATVSPQYKEASGIKAAISHYYMAFDVGNMLANSFQNFVTTAPYLTRYYNMPYSKAVGLAAKSVVEAGKIKFGREHEIKDPELRAAFLRAKQEGITEMGIRPEFQNLDQDIAGFDLWRFSQGDTPAANLYSTVKNGMYQYAQTTSKPYRWIEFNNNRASFIAGYKTAREQGMSVNDAYTEGLRVMSATQYGKGRAGKPIFLDKFGQMGSVASIAYSLQHYALSFYNQFINYGMDAIGNTGLKGAELHQSRKAFVGMVATQMLLAGMRGVPFVAAGIGLLEQLGFDVKNEVQDYVSNNGKSPEGQMFGNMLLRGGAAVAMDLDLGPKFSMGSIPLTGFGETGFNPANILGPSTGIVKNLITSSNMFLHDQPEAGFENMVPGFLKGPVQLWRGGGNLPERDSNTKMQELTDFDRVSTFLGVKPINVSNQLETMQRLKRSSEDYKIKVGRLYDDAATKMMGNDLQGAVEVMRGLNKSDPSISLASAASNVIQRMEDERFGQDPALFSGKVAPEERDRILMMQQGKSSSITDRMMFRQQVKQLLSQAIPEIKVATFIQQQKQLNRAAQIEAVMDQFGIPYNAAMAMVDLAAKGKDSQAVLGR